MAFRDFFRAKHLHSDPAVRIAALVSLEPGTLLEVARFDADRDVRRQAVESLDDDGLMQVACRDSDPDVMLAAGARLRSAEHRAMWGSARPEALVLEALSGLSQAELTDVILAATRSTSALALLKHVQAQENLTRVAYEAANGQVRKQAAKRLPQSELVEVVLVEPKAKFGLALLEHVAADEHRLRIACGAKTQEVREQAATSLSEPSSIYQVLCAGVSQGLQKGLVRKLPLALLKEKLVPDADMPKGVRKLLEHRLEKFKFMVTEVTESETCTNCGQPLFIRAVSLEHPCEYCSHVSVWQRRHWTAGILEKPLRTLLACQGCETEVGETCGESCSTCGLSLSLQPTPDWLVNFHRDSRRVHFVEAPTAAGSKKTGEREPIHMACTQCNANLSVDADSPRLMTCEYCDAQLYLPSDVWFTFHSVPTKSAVRIVWGPVGERRR